MTNILKGYSTRKDGSMYLSSDGFSVENIKHRKRFFTARRLIESNIVAANLTHGTNVAIVDHSSPGFVLDTDALVTKESDIVLTLTGADCFPVYFEDKTAGVIGLAHCGWRGIVGGIVPKTVEALIALGAASEHIYLTIGPGICKHHFEVKEHDLEAFAEFPETIIRGETLSVDLKKIIIAQARRSGIPRKHMTDKKECTYCLPEKYYSYRRDKPQELETQVAYITQRRQQ